MVSVDKIKIMLIDLAKELEARNLNDLALSFSSLANKVKEIEKISIYSKKTALLLQNLNEETKNIAERIARGGTNVVREQMEKLLELYDKTIYKVLHTYLKTRIIVVLFITLYTIVSAKGVTIHIYPDIASAFMVTLLWMGTTLLAAILLNLSMATFMMPLIPLTSAIAFIHTEHNIVSLCYIVLHITTLVILSIFIVRNINSYRMLKSSLADLERSLSGLINNIRNVVRLYDQTVDRDMSRYIDIYYDKAYELIKYVNDMRKLVGQQ